MTLAMLMDSQVSVSVQKMIDQVAGRRVALRAEFRIVGLRGRLEDRIEEQLSVLDPPPGKPLYGHEELGTEAQQLDFRNRLVRLADQRPVHSTPPLNVRQIVAAEGSGTAG